MSSFDQAFVKAFSRRNRSSAGRVTQTPDTAKPNAGTVASINPNDEPGSLKVDQSVADSAKVWIDPVEDQIARSDTADSVVPEPHHDAIVDSVATEVVNDPAAPLMQHIHTAYASAIADLTVEPAASNPAPQIELSPEIEAPQDTQPPDIQPLDSEIEQRAVESVPDARFDPPSDKPNEPHTITPIRAVWEVDVFDVPANVADLFFDGNLVQQIAERLSEAVGSGLSSILVTSEKAGEGRSSVAIGLAMAAAAANIRVALVDADIENPTLADDLRLDLQYGWVDTIRGGLPIKEVAVHAVEDGVTLIPLMPPHGRTAATGFEVVQLTELLKRKFELVVIDGPAGDSPNLHQCASVVDSAVIVRDTRRTNSLAVSKFSSRLLDSGVQGVGIVENFASLQQQSPESQQSSPSTVSL